MSQIVSFTDYTPPARFDSVPWSEVRIEEALIAAGPWTQIDTLALSPLDADPSDPASRSFTTAAASDTPELWYRVIFADASADTSLPSVPIQNLEVAEPYTTTAELFRILKVRSPTAAQEAAAERVLLSATCEINATIDRSVDDSPFTNEELAILAGVCLDRGADLWRHTESVPGIMGPLDDTPVTLPAFTRYSFERYARRLQPLKQGWGMA